jgi:hypothetical protein
VVVFTFYQCTLRSSENANIDMANFSLNRGCVSLEAKINELPAVVVIDNGNALSFVDSLFFSQLDTTVYRLIKKDEWFGMCLYKGQFDVTINHEIYSLDSFYVMNLQGLGAGKVDMILGYDLLKNHILYFNFKDSIFDFLNMYDDTKYTTIPLFPSESEIQNKLVEIKTYIQKENHYTQGLFVLDLGTTGTELMSTHKYLHTIKENVIQIDKNKVALNAFRQKNSAAFWNIDSIKISNISLKNIHLTVQSIHYPNEDRYVDPLMFLEADGYLGLNLLTRFNSIIIDFPQNRLLVEYNNKTD